jgi:hypothetical protein
MIPLKFEPKPLKTLLTMSKKGDLTQVFYFIAFKSLERPQMKLETMLKQFDSTGSEFDSKGSASSGR